jgi:hypothetical protein
MYYVYELIDPRTNQPFYIGKGKGRRAKTHLWEVPETRNRYKENKIESIRKVGLEPKIHYVVENIQDSDLAYEIESLLIKKYGRKGYDKGGILTNICEDARPPNHKGKTYEEIYGPERAQVEKQKRLETKRKNNNYGGVNSHKQSTKDRIRNSVIESHSRRDCSHKKSTKEKIGQSNSKYVGRLNKKSKGYHLLSPRGKEYTLYGKELSDFCLENNLSYGTFKKTLQKNWPPSHKGKNQGWVITKI